MYENNVLPEAVDLEIDGGYVSPFFTNETTEQGDKVTVLRDPHIVIHNEVLSCYREILLLMEHSVQINKALLFIGSGVTGEALALLVKNADLGRRPFAAVKVSGCGAVRRAVLDDVATITGGMVFDDDLGLNLRYLTEYPRKDLVLGAAKMVRIGKTKTMVFGGGGRPLMAARNARITPDSVWNAPGPLADAEQMVAMKPKRAGGRRPKYNWLPVLVKLRNRLEDDGAPAIGDGGQAVLEQFVASQFPDDACPVTSVIREKVRGEIEAFRRNLQQQGR